MSTGVEGGEGWTKVHDELWQALAVTPLRMMGVTIDDAGAAVWPAGEVEFGDYLATVAMALGRMARSVAIAEGENDA